MELQFQKSVCFCLDTALRDIQNAEQTQEIKLTDGMPDVGHIICAWGQMILRSKEWRSDRLSCSAGMMVWVLYAPEDGSVERCIDTWIPFQIQWDLPEGIREGSIRIRGLTRFVDARPVSARKIMVRAGVAAMAEAFVPMDTEIYAPVEMPEPVQLLRSRYPVRLQKEAGEKTFLHDEELTLPGSGPRPEELISYRVNPGITDKKVMANKVVFRGNTNLHVLCRCEDGRLHSWDFDLPFSQFAELEGEYSPDARADMVLTPTSLELELGDEGHLRFKGGLVGQYLITDKQMLELIEDAYSPDRDVKLQRRMLELPAVLEDRRENIYGEQTVPADGATAADIQLLQDFPRQNRSGNGVEIELPGTFQVLYYGEDGVLRSGTARWEGRYALDADINSRVLASVSPAANLQATQSGGQLILNGDIPMELTTTAQQEIPMVSGLEAGQPRQADPGRPSLIFRRAGDDRLWDIAKENNSTVDAIRRANHLQEEPLRDQMLLIPVG